MDRPLRILQVGAFPFPTHQGSQVYVAGVARSLAALGHEVRIACFGDGDGDGPPGVALVRARGVPGGGATRRSGPHWSRLPQGVLLARAVRRALPGVDLVAAHNVEAPVAAWIARGRRPIPLVWHLHTRMAEELPTYLPGVPGAGAFGRAVDSGIPRVCDGAVAISERARAWLAPRVPELAEVGPGVDPGELRGGDAARARRRWGLGDRPVVVYAGNADAYQDLPDLMAAMARTPEATLLVVTGSPVAVVERLANLAGLPPARRRLVHSRAFVDTLDALRAADVAALPRRRCAGFPSKLLNQLGLGVPTVAAAGSAQPIPGVVTVPNGDPAAMSDAIGRLLADPARRLALGVAAREAILRDWTWEVQARRLAAFYEHLVRAVGPRSGIPPAIGRAPRGRRW